MIIGFIAVLTMAAGLIGALWYVTRPYEPEKKGDPVPKSPHYPPTRAFPSGVDVRKNERYLRNVRNRPMARPADPAPSSSDGFFTGLAVGELLSSHGNEQSSPSPSSVSDAPSGGGGDFGGGGASGSWDSGSSGSDSSSSSSGGGDGS